ncbi:hypothetical protein [Bradyrhizobium sp. CB3481]|uniref:hypothetical protein n=1 Tax=Bradyrhizobium sp. CB3481 TaxID=3039158 RepID=UPI0024B137DF|nr:hypothetical protein [Bradyrhizobium sp. CB3481]WFU16640.1 hypothetical protein QA643_37885 [Bradyrhizobium sp. CB3481]
MTKKTHVVDTFDNAHFQRFNSDLIGNEMAHLLSQITMNWGKLEQALYLSMKSIDVGQANEWREAFFSTPALAARKEKARKNIGTKVATSNPKLLTFFEETLDRFQDVQHRRNALSHALWLPIETPNQYPVQPLRYDRANMSFDPIRVVDLKFLGDLLEDMTDLSRRIYWVGAELLAHQQLKKWGKR